MDWCMYKYRHLVENAFVRIKQYRAIDTRYKMRYVPRRAYDVFVKCIKSCI